MIFQHSRFQIWNVNQHPLKHTLDDFTYSNPGMGTQVSSIEGALDYLFAVLYPQQQPAVANVAALPLVGNTINDMRVVEDDGDGKAASYRWEQREGEVAASWHKIYDVDFGTDSILQAWQIKTQDVYLSRFGYDDRDENAVVITGLYAGQNFYGGASANTNLTLHANSGDGTGPRTGFIQFDDQVRPTLDDTFELGTTALRFAKIWVNEVEIGTLNLQPGSIEDSGGEIDFGATDLTTTGALTVGSLNPTSLVVGGTLTLASGSITDTGGSISFGNENLSTTGTLGSGIFTVTDSAQTIVLDPDATGNASINVSRATLTFGATNLLTTGTLNVGNATTTQLNADNLRLDGNTISSQNTDGNIVIDPNGTGLVDIQSSVSVLGTLAVNGDISVDNLMLDGNTISSTDTDGNIILSPDGVGVVNVSSSIIPGTTSVFDLGSSGNVWNKLYLDGSIDDGTDETSVATIISLRDVNVGVGLNYSIFWDGTKWISSLPDTEVDHNQTSNLTVGDVHTQYLFHAGRAGGQNIIGGTAATNNLTLESTSNASKGKILVKDNLSPFTTASFSVTWAGTDLGATTNTFRHVYTKGEFFGLRLENVAVNPSSSAQNPGRLVWNTADEKVYVDTGTAIQPVGDVTVFTSDESFDGIVTSKSVTVSGVADARMCVWQLRDNTNDFEVMYVTITSTSATNVTITTNIPLPAGTYRLIGMGA